MAVVIQCASFQDRDGAVDFVSKLCQSREKVVSIFANEDYREQTVEIIKAKFNPETEIIKISELHTFKILPKRWIVEGIFAWIDTNRRNSKNNEHLILPVWQWPTY